MPLLGSFSRRKLLPYTGSLLLVFGSLTALSLCPGSAESALAGSTIGLYLLYWALGIVLPGVLVGRWLAPKEVTGVSFLALAAAIGISLQILLWFVLAPFGFGMYSAPCALVLALGVFVFGAHQKYGSFNKIDISDLVRLPKGQTYHFLESILLAGNIAYSILTFDWYERSFILPPAGGNLYQDQWWHLSLQQEFIHGHFPQTPQVAGERLNYHYFVHIHAALSSYWTDIRPEVVLNQLWWIPVVALVVLLASALARLLAGSKAWVGPAAAWFALTGGMRGFWFSGLGGFAYSPLYYLSPTQVLAQPMLFALCIAAVSLIKKGYSKKGFTLFLLLCLGAFGTKSTVMPVVFAGLLYSIAVSFILRIRVKRDVLILCGTTFGVQALALLFASGTTAGGSSYSLRSGG